MEHVACLVVFGIEWNVRSNGFDEDGYMENSSSGSDSSDSPDPDSSSDSSDSDV